MKTHQYTILNTARLMIFSLVLAGFLLWPRIVEAAPHTLRTWTYFSLAASLSPNWSLLIIPGYKHEFWRSEGDRGNSLLYELFLGPALTLRQGNFSCRLPLYYYYLGFPSAGNEGYRYSHHAAFVPVVSYTLGSFTASMRLFFHNTFYASTYETERMRKGYSLLITCMPGIAYAVSDNIRLLVSDEIFYGIVEDSEAPATSGIGFFRRGFAKNKLYTGMEIVGDGSVGIKIQYVYETSYRRDYRLERVDHVLFVVISYTLTL